MYDKANPQMISSLATAMLQMVDSNYGVGSFVGWSVKVIINEQDPLVGNIPLDEVRGVNIKVYLDPARVVKDEA